MSYKHLDPETIARVAAEVDQELDRRAAQQAEIDHFAQVAAWANNPANAQQLTRIQAELQRVEEAHRAKYAPQRAPQPQQRPAATSGTPQSPIPANARFDPSHLKNQPSYIPRIVDPVLK